VGALPSILLFPPVSVRMDDHSRWRSQRWWRPSPLRIHNTSWTPAGKWRRRNKDPLLPHCPLHLLLTPFGPHPLHLPKRTATRRWVGQEERMGPRDVLEGQELLNACHASPLLTMCPRAFGTYLGRVLKTRPNEWKGGCSSNKQSTNPSRGPQDILHYLNS